MALKGGYKKIAVEYSAGVSGQTGCLDKTMLSTSEAGCEKIVQLLIEMNADVNAQGGQYGKALQAASYNGHENIVQLLVEIGASINAQSGANGNALQAAADAGHEEIVQLQLTNGTDVNARGSLAVHCMRHHVKATRRRCICWLRNVKRLISKMDLGITRRA